MHCFCLLFYGTGFITDKGYNQSVRSSSVFPVEPLFSRFSRTKSYENDGDIYRNTDLQCFFKIHFVEKQIWIFFKYVSSKAFSIEEGKFI